MLQIYAPRQFVACLFLTASIEKEVNFAEVKLLIPFAS